eukprot:tig00020902_g15061.t1
MAGAIVSYSIDVPSGFLQPQSQQLELAQQEQQFAVVPVQMPPLPVLFHTPWVPQPQKPRPQPSDYFDAPMVRTIAKDGKGKAPSFLKRFKARPRELFPKNDAGELDLARGVEHTQIFIFDSNGDSPSSPPQIV